MKKELSIILAAAVAATSFGACAKQNETEDSSPVDTLSAEEDVQSAVESDSDSSYPAEDEIASSESDEPIEGKYNTYPTETLVGENSPLLGYWQADNGSMYIEADEFGGEGFTVFMYRDDTENNLGIFTSRLGSFTENPDSGMISYCCTKENGSDYYIYNIDSSFEFVVNDDNTLSVTSNDESYTFTQGELRDDFYSDFEGAWKPLDNSYGTYADETTLSYKNDEKLFESSDTNETESDIFNANSADFILNNGQDTIVFVDVTVDDYGNGLVIESQNPDGNIQIMLTYTSLCISDGILGRKFIPISLFSSGDYAEFERAENETEDGGQKLSDDYQAFGKYFNYISDHGIDEVNGYDIIDLDNDGIHEIVFAEDDGVYKLLKLNSNGEAELYPCNDYTVSDLTSAYYEPEWYNPTNGTIIFFFRAWDKTIDIYKADSKSKTLKKVISYGYRLSVEDGSVKGYYINGEEVSEKKYNEVDNKYFNDDIAYFEYKSGSLMNAVASWQLSLQSGE